MFFTSSIIIVFFCFAFYLIWDQFLKKDSRLSTGLHILRKKMQELEHLSLKVDHQVNRQMSVLEERKEEVAFQIQEARRLRNQLEDILKNIQPAIDNTLVETASAPARNEKTNQSQTRKKKLPEFHFGNSPFIDSDYEDPAPIEAP